MPIGGVVSSALIEQYKYHYQAEKYLEEKYQETVRVHNERLPLGELNFANFYDYRYSFEINDRKHFLTYYKEIDYWEVE